MKCYISDFLNNLLNLPIFLAHSAMLNLHRALKCTTPNKAYYKQCYSSNNAWLLFQCHNKSSNTVTWVLVTVLELCVSSAPGYSHIFLYLLESFVLFLGSLFCCEQQSLPCTSYQSVTGLTQRDSHSLSPINLTPCLFLDWGNWVSGNNPSDLLAVRWRCWPPHHCATHSRKPLPQKYKTENSVCL